MVLLTHFPQKLIQLCCSRVYCWKEDVWSGNDLVLDYDRLFTDIPHRLFARCTLPSASFLTYMEKISLEQSCGKAMH